MRRLLVPSLVLVSAFSTSRLAAQSILPSGDGSLAGMREIGLFLTGRVLSTNYSVSDARSAVGGAITGASHLSRFFAIQGGLGIAYGPQDKTYYKPPLVTFTPTLSLLLQSSTANQFQPYALAGVGYEFVRYTHPRCDCNQSRSLGIGNVGAGVREMIGDRRAFRIEVTSQIGSGGPAFSAAMGFALFVGGAESVIRRPPERTRTQPAAIPAPPPQRTTPSKILPAPAPAPPPAPAPQQPPAAVIPRTVPPAAPAPNLAGTVLLTIDGTQVDFNKPTWRDDAEPLLDGLAVDLTSDAGERIRISIEAHTDNIGSRAGNVALGLDRVKAVRDFMVNQGINADRITVSSVGGENPIAPNNTAMGRQRNRRIVVRRTN